jgi:hypothetical protein
MVSHSGESFNLDSSLFFSGNEKKERDVALGDEKVSIISYSPKLRSITGLKSLFSHTYKEPYD